MPKVGGGVACGAGDADDAGDAGSTGKCDVSGMRWCG